MRVWLGQTLVPEAGDRSHNVCKDGVAPGESAALLKALEVLDYVPFMHVAGLMCRAHRCGKATRKSKAPVCACGSLNCSKGWQQAICVAASAD